MIFIKGYVSDGKGCSLQDLVSRMVSRTPGAILWNKMHHSPFLFFIFLHMTSPGVLDTKSWREHLFLLVITKPECILSIPKVKSHKPMIIFPRRLSVLTHAYVGMPLIDTQCVFDFWCLFFFFFSNT